ncbi:MAG: penicillin-binding protein 1A [Desulfobacterales bacterium]|nr:penicillin-binding protein 1A [Desulfobacterales bacterium]
MKKIIILSIIGGIITGVSIGIFLAVTKDLPQIQALEDFTPPLITKIYSRDNDVLAELYTQKRYRVKLNDMPTYLKKGLLAIEDRNFYEHSGLDLRGIARAIIKDIISLKLVEGASTLTQQLAKTIFLSNKKSFVRKLKEAVLSIQIERRYTKNEILELYLNQVYFGCGAYGVESASKIFFGKSVKELTLAECALLAGMPQSPSRYCPYNNKELALNRRNIVLSQMLKYKVIKKNEYEDALSEPIFLSNTFISKVNAPYFIDYIKNELEDVIGYDLLYKGGLSIYTTLSFDLQKIAEDSIASNLEALDKRTAVSNAQAALIAIDVKTGEILSMVGGRNYSKSKFNRALSAKRQPGSAFKPILYAYAVEKDMPQNMLILDAPVAFKGSRKGEYWTPENFSKSFSGEITLRYALAYSKNIPAVRLLDMLGVSPVIEFAHNLGIESQLNPTLSLALGTSEVTLMELTSAYAVFPNGGQKIKPFGIIEVKDKEGNLLLAEKLEKKIVMSKIGASIITNMLEGVVQEGTGKRSSYLSSPLGGKTGTTDNYKDALFIGFSPSVAVGVWVGRDDSTPIGKGETGAKAALPIWIAFMEKAIEKSGLMYFDIPDGVVNVKIDPITGKRSFEIDSVDALFKKGTEPN